MNEYIGKSNRAYMPGGSDMAKRNRKVTTATELGRVLSGLEVFGAYSLEYVSNDTKKMSRKTAVKMEKLVRSHIWLTKKTYAEFVNSDGTVKKDIQPLWKGYGKRLSPAIAGHFKDLETEQKFENADKLYLYIYNASKINRSKTLKYLIDGVEVNKEVYKNTFDTWVLPSELTAMAKRQADQAAGIRAPLMIDLNNIKALKRGNTIYTL